MIGLILLFPIICIVVALIVAAKRGYTMPVKICIILISIGAGLVLAPTAFSFLLQLFGRDPEITTDESTACWIVGGLMLIVGVIESILARPATHAPSQ